ncbi:MAG: hypothetical protein JHC26_08765 [Thermofilum sp.]|jgi:hypothetical protein|uniref:hypothetical protein n=1 Tax=Thermofilum sp. TaxID=1961369 RepID=UPI002589EA07|nr:hypothetical protein [Thermofilum sp.]MCI4409169.1 hypothetical protein [Thermofilum sp.]
MNKNNAERESGPNIGKIILFVFLLVASISIISLILRFLDTNGIIKLPLFVYHELCVTFVCLLGLIDVLAIFALITKAIGILYNRWRMHKEKTQ